EPFVVDLVNTHGVTEACKDPGLRRAMASYDALVPDSRPLVWTINAKGARMPDVVAGYHFVPRLLASLRRPTKIAVIGGFAETHRRLRRLAPEPFPNVVFELLYEAPLAPVDAAYVDASMDLVEGSGADLVFVCLGVPRQY